jgi:predicted RNase H-like HicB family nuclease
MTMQVTAVATRTGNWWAVEVPEIHGLYTQVKRLGQVADTVREAAALLTDEPIEAVIVRAVLPDNLQTIVDQVRREAAEAEAAQRRAAEDTRALVARLRSQGYSVRDVGTVLGVSPQRVSQLAAST